MSLRPLLLLPLLALASLLRAGDAPAALDRAALLAGLSADLTAHYLPDGDLEVDLVRPWSAPAAADGATALSATVLEFPVNLASSMLVRVRYLRGDTILLEEALALRVNLWRDSLVTAVPRGRGERLSLDGLEPRRVDVLRERQAVPAAILSEDMVVARDMPAGRLLTWRDVVRRSLVKRGGVVEVVATEGGFAISMKGLAMQDGAKGDVVRVRNLESRREFTALVTAENRAEVRF